MARLARAPLWLCSLWGTLLACLLGTCISGLGWLCLRRRTRPQTRSKVLLPARELRRLRLSVIIAAHNEEAVIRRTLKHCDETAIERDDVELVIIDAGSTDRTREVAERVSTRIAKRVVTSVAERGTAQNDGAAHASGDALLFLHADTRLPVGWDKLVRDCLRKPDVVAGAFSFAVDRETCEGGQAPVGMGTVEWFANLRARVFFLPYGDQALFLLRERWRRLGPFPAQVMMEDFELVRVLRARAVAEGGRIAVLPEAARCSGRRWEAKGVLWTTLLNQWFVFAYSVLGVSVEAIARAYYGNRPAQEPRHPRQPLPPRPIPWEASHPPRSPRIGVSPVMGASSGRLFDSGSEGSLRLSPAADGAGAVGAPSVGGRSARLRTASSISSSNGPAHSSPLASAVLASSSAGGATHSADAGAQSPANL